MTKTLMAVSLLLSIPACSKARTCTGDDDIAACDRACVEDEDANACRHRTELAGAACEGTKAHSQWPSRDDACEARDRYMMEDLKKFKSKLK